MICGSHGLFVVLDHNDRVSLIAQTLQAFQQHGVIARMQTNTGFIQNVNHTDQAAADLAGQSNSL